MTQLEFGVAGELAVLLDATALVPEAVAAALVALGELPLLPHAAIPPPDATAAIAVVAAPHAVPVIIKLFH